MAEAFKDFVNYISSPTMSFFLVVALFAISLFARRFVWNPRVAGPIGLVLLVVLAWSYSDPDFWLIAMKADNVPIMGMLVLVGFFTWLSMWQAVQNDERIKKGEPVMEAEDGNKKVWCWPDLVYSELIALLLCTVVLFAWSILLEAPIEQPANPANTPNPSKAPWYFLGLQEMLVYFDPWLAGVVLPTFIIVGLQALPYIDTNPKGNGYYTFNERKGEITIFLFGFLILWVYLIAIGTFLRGPNWNFFGPYEYWDSHKLEALVNVNLSEFFWVYSPWGSGYPLVFSGGPRAVLNILLRESPGILAVVLYFALGPWVLKKSVMHQIRVKMGELRFQIAAHLLLWMALMPIKMVCRWFFNLKYIVAIPEWFFNI